MQFRKIVLRGAVVTGAAQAIRVIVRFVSVIVLARLLTPTDFGLVAAVTPLVAFITLFQELGLRQAVVQRAEISDVQLNQVFWVTVLAGTICMLVVMAISPGIAAFYGDDRLTGIAMVIGVPVLISSMSALHLGLLGRRMQFAQLALNDVFGVIAGTAISVGAACLGFGYWSILFGTVASAAAMLAASWYGTRWVPGRPDFHIDRDIFAFGAHLTGFTFVNFFRQNLDNVLIGKFSGPVELGFYDRAYKLLLFPIQNINNPMGRVLLPVLSRFQDDKPRLREAYLRAVGMLALAIIPGITALAANSEETIRLLLGERWMPAAPLFAWLGLAGIMQPIANSTGWLYLSQGHTREMMRFGLFSSLVTIAGFCVGLPWGAVGVAAAYAVATGAIQPVQWWYIGRIGPVGFLDFASVQLPYLASGAVIFFIAEVLRAETELAGWEVVLISLAISYATALLAISTTKPGRLTTAEVISLAYRVLDVVLGKQARSR